jgi:hypothetical protein
MKQEYNFFMGRMNGQSFLIFRIAIALHCIGLGIGGVHIACLLDV